MDRAAHDRPPRYPHGRAAGGTPRCASAPSPRPRLVKRLADEAQAETARLKREEGDLLTRLTAIRAELLALAAIQQAAGASYGEAG